MALETQDGRVLARLTKSTMTLRVHYGYGSYVDISLVELLRDAKVSSAEAYRLVDASVTRKETREQNVRTQFSSRYRGRNRLEFITAHGTRCRHCCVKGDERVGPDGKPWHIDHLVPVSVGGGNDPSNLALSCARCNTARGNRPLKAD